jgi:hypothetical protein
MFRGKCVIQKCRQRTGKTQRQSAEAAREIPKRLRLTGIASIANTNPAPEDKGNKGQVAMQQIAELNASVPKL